MRHPRTSLGGGALRSEMVSYCLKPGGAGARIRWFDGGVAKRLKAAVCKTAICRGFESHRRLQVARTIPALLRNLAGLRPVGLRASGVPAQQAVREVLSRLKIGSLRGGDPYPPRPYLNRLAAGFISTACATAGLARPCSFPWSRNARRVKPAVAHTVVNGSKGRNHLDRGSKASLRPSPTKFKARSVAPSIAHGAASSHQ